MASSFDRKASRAVGTSVTSIGSYTVGASKTTTVIGLTVANITGSTVNASVSHYDGTNTTYIVKDAPILPGGSLCVVGGDQKIVLLTGDSMRVVSSAASSVDAFMSILEIGI